MHSNNAAQWCTHFLIIYLKFLLVCTYHHGILVDRKEMSSGLFFLFFCPFALGNLVF